MIKISEICRDMKPEQLSSKHKVIHFILNRYKPFVVLNATPPQAVDQLIKWGGEDIEVKQVYFTLNNGYVDLDEVK